MKIREIIVESSEELGEAGFWSSVKAGITGAKNAIETNKVNRQHAAQTKQTDAEINRLAQVWLNGWWQQASGLPDARLNDPAKYATELVAYCKWILHNDKFTIDTPPAITFNPPKTPPTTTKNDVNLQSVEAFIKTAIAQRNVQPAAPAPVTPAAPPTWDDATNTLSSPASKRKFKHIADAVPATSTTTEVPGEWQQTHKNNRRMARPITVKDNVTRRKLDAAMQDAINRGFGSV